MAASNGDKKGWRPRNQAESGFFLLFFGAAVIFIDHNLGVHVIEVGVLLVAWARWEAARNSSIPGADERGPLPASAEKRRRMEKP